MITKEECKNGISAFKDSHMNQQTLGDWLAYLNNLPSGFTITSLDHVQQVAAQLQIKTHAFPCPVICVAGTNGKGSCVIFLEAILLTAGYKVGAYISPHVLRYNERIRYNGKDINDVSLCQAFAAVENARTIAFPITQLSYFEFSTLAALYFFQQQVSHLDIIILEVGLGGRFDAVNIMNADIAIITSISLDHTQLLGNTREAIAKEKAEIMRANKPIICGDNAPPANIYAHARTVAAPLYCSQRDFTYTLTNANHWQWQYHEISLDNLPMPRLPLQNAATALMAIQLLQQQLSFIIPPQAINMGLNQAFLLGRFQTIYLEGREIILDVAHNPASTALLAQKLEAYSSAKFDSSRRILAVVSMLKDKDIIASLQPLIPLISNWYIGAINSPRAATLQQLEQSLQMLEAKNIKICSSLPHALQQAIASATKKDRIVVFGSFYTVGEILKVTH